MIKYLVGVEAIMPTDHLTYTIEDEFVLSLPTASIQFLGWYLDHDGNGEQILNKINRPTIDKAKHAIDDIISLLVISKYGIVSGYS